MSKPPWISPPAAQVAAQMSAAPERLADVFGRGTVMLDVINCPRCTQSHPGMVFSPLTNAVKVANATYWAPCPTTLEPTLLQVTDPNDPTKDQFH